MIHFSRAFEIVMGNCFSTDTELVSFAGSLHRVLAEDIRADRDLPPFNRAAVDGYACRKEDAGKELTVKGLAKAGESPLFRIEKQECCKIMTGAIVPDGADFVFMVEDAETAADGKISFRGSTGKNNISVMGEDVKAGQVVLGAGKIITARDIAVLASVGHVTVKVASKPLVGIISTGDEIVEPDDKPGPPEIRNSNAWQLLAQVESAGGTGRYYGIAPDDEESTFSIVSEAMAENDIIILTGGVSMGDYDFVPAVLKRAGVEILFDQVMVQPGKPTTFGRYKNGVVFALPGNPVSCFVQFEVLVKPFMYGMCRADWRPDIFPVPMAVRYERKSTTRAAWVPVRITGDYRAEPVEYHGSAHITAMPGARGIVFMEIGQKILEKDEVVNVRLF
ncbi:MAG: molybdopterin molybdotransferase MoeA [Bacteroidales bacterium]|nr:molybdopterin molybdotransferase MoeA [Bacteroidales bacterium]